MHSVLPPADSVAVSTDVFPQTASMSVLPAALILFGLVNIYSSSTGDATAAWNWNSKYGMQLLWFGVVGSKWSHLT